MVEVLAWYLALQAAALAAWPLVARALAPLDDRGWAIAKAAGLLLLAWLAWLLSMLTPLPYTRPALFGLLAALALGAWVVAPRVPGAGVDVAALVGWMRVRRATLLAWEALFAAALGYFLLLRTYEPNVVGTEKPMDMMFLNTFVAAGDLPTQDGWLAGYGVPYYYLGYFVFATLVKLSGVNPWVGYNLAAATVPALASLGLAGLAWSLGRAAAPSPRWAALGALLAPTLVVLAGNLTAVAELLFARGLLSTADGAWLGIKNFGEGIRPGVWPPPDSGWWWHSSRVAPNIQPDGINESPFFSILLSDLHPHFVVLPFEALVLTVLAVHVLCRGESLRAWWTQALAALALGGLMIANTWDVAPFFPLYVGGSLLSATALSWRERAWRVLVAPLLGVALVAPYFVGYASPPLGLDLVRERLRLGTFLVLFGGQVALLVVVGVWLRTRVRDRQGWVALAVGLVAAALFALRGEHTLAALSLLVALFVPLAGTLLALAPPERYVLLVGGFAVAMLLGTELIFLKDSFGTRMNTVFKFHYNAWLLGGLAAAVGVVLVAQARHWARYAALAVAGVVVAAGLVYPVSATATRLSLRPLGGPTLDGTAFLPTDEMNAIRWLHEQTGAQRPVVAEAVGGQYSMFARMSSYSGAATILGWAGHELQWRGPIPELGQRENDVEQIYRNADPSAIRTLLDRYRVDYVVVGDLERQKYGDAVDTRFADLLPIAYRSGRLAIYRAR